MRLTNRKAVDRNPREAKFGIDKNKKPVDESFGKSEEEKMLDKIVEETASSMIDISMNPIAHSLNRYEAQERCRWYAKRLEQLSPSLIKPCLGSGRLLADVRKPFLHKTKRNEADVISEEDVALVLYP